MKWNPWHAWQAYKQRRRDERARRAKAEANLKMIQLNPSFDTVENAKKRRREAQAEC